MAKNQQDKLQQKRAAFLERTAIALGVSEDKALRLASIGRQQSLRINPLQPNTHVIEELMALGWSGKQFSWFKDGYTIETGLVDVRDSNVVAKGQVYIQNAASWLPVLVLDPQPGEAILDVCAAPGGKTSHIAAMTGDQARLTANDNSRPRLSKMQANLTRLGVQDVTYTLIEATAIARRLEGQEFDKILLDAPCSGEGMMTYASDKDFASWSVAHIKRLQQLQKKIITQAWQLLKPGGTLVYSTCTMAPEENEAVIDYLLRHQEDVQIDALQFDLANQVPPVMTWNGKNYNPEITKTLRLAPSPEIEAFFVCKFTKI